MGSVLKPRINMRGPTYVRPEVHRVKSGLMGDIGRRKAAEQLEALIERMEKTKIARDRENIEVRIKEYKELLKTYDNQKLLDGLKKRLNGANGK